MNTVEQPMFQEVQRYLGVLKRRKSLVLASVGVSLLGATAYNYSARPLYRASVRLLFEPTMPEILPGRGRIVRRDRDDMTTQYEILRGRVLAERVVEQTRLTQSEELRTGPLMSPWERFERRVLGRKPDSDEQDIAMTPAVAAFRSRVGVEPVPQSNIVTVTFTAYDPEIAAQAVNTLATTYIEHQLELQTSSSSEATGWLSARLDDQKSRLERAERALHDYEQRAGITNVEERERLLDQKLGALHGALMGARTTRMAKETSFNELQALPPEERAEFPLVRDDPAIQSLRADLDRLERERIRQSQVLGDRHPDMIALVAQIAETRKRIVAETDRVVRSLGSDYRLALEQEQTFEASIEPVQEELQAMKGATIEYDILKREVQSNEQLLRNLMNRTKESGLAGQLDTRDVQILERAETPRAPFYPQKMKNYRLAAIAGLALGLSLILIVEQMDQTLKTPDDVKLHLAVPLLGIVPDAVGRLRPNAPLATPMILRNPRSAMAEAYRVVRTNLIFTTAEREGRSLVVSSAHPGEGKSTTALNVAASLAQNGSRVLVVDADLRRPTLHEQLGLSAAPGLSDLIVGKCQRAEAVRTTAYTGLDALTSGYLPPNPAELLGSARVRVLLSELRQDYDWILVDTPPILVVADAPILAPLLDGLVLVIAADQTPRAAAARAIEQVAAVGGKVLGAVLNRLDVERTSEYYGSGYGGYYSSRSEGPHAVKRKRPARPSAPAR